ncbi:uncharacterized protein CEXT_617431 [Caerostris extrusa]|uniref:Uncharacterized protein n=1 Tax=Caerostris extrusa TaxID=172846 RepID=A0AAV4PIM9_CAEEX|nr:uncharacterized protein CEXT_617431 [Caerostris extrusa]
MSKPPLPIKKDEKLSPGAVKEVALPVNEALKPLNTVTALYLRYNGWFTKGAETFGLAPVSIKDSQGNVM